MSVGSATALPFDEKLRVRELLPLAAIVASFDVTPVGLGERLSVHGLVLPGPVTLPLLGNTTEFHWTLCFDGEKAKSMAVIVRSSPVEFFRSSCNLFTVPVRARIDGSRFCEVRWHAGGGCCWMYRTSCWVHCGVPLFVMVNVAVYVPWD